MIRRDSLEEEIEFEKSLAKNGGSADDLKWDADFYVQDFIELNPELKQKITEQAKDKRFKLGIIYYLKYLGLKLSDFPEIAKQEEKLFDDFCAADDKKTDAEDKLKDAKEALKLDETDPDLIADVENAENELKEATKEAAEAEQLYNFTKEAPEPNSDSGNGYTYGDYKNFFGDLIKRYIKNYEATHGITCKNVFAEICDDKGATYISWYCVGSREDLEKLKELFPDDILVDEGVDFDKLPTRKAVFETTGIDPAASSETLYKQKNLEWNEREKRKKEEPKAETEVKTEVKAEEAQQTETKETTDDMNGLKFKFKDGMVLEVADDEGKSFAEIKDEAIKVHKQMVAFKKAQTPELEVKNKLPEFKYMYKVVIGGETIGCYDTLEEAQAAEEKAKKPAEEVKEQDNATAGIPTPELDETVKDDATVVLAPVQTEEEAQMDQPTDTQPLEQLEPAETAPETPADVEIEINLEKINAFEDIAKYAECGTWACTTDEELFNKIKGEVKSIYAAKIGDKCYIILEVEDGNYMAFNANNEIEDIWQDAELSEILTNAFKEDKEDTAIAGI